MRVVRVPTNVLISLSAVFSIAGTYAVNLLMFDVVLMLSFAALGILLHRFGYLLIAVVLGIVLVPILDAELLRTYQADQHRSVGIRQPARFLRNASLVGLQSVDSRVAGDSAAAPTPNPLMRWQGNGALS